MKFLHTADTHLGKKNYKITEREEDFYKAFKYVIKTAINEKVNFIIHSGDLFETGRPEIKILIQAIEELKKLKEQGIKFYITPGNHDITTEGTIITILERVGLLINIANPRYYEIGKKIKLKGEMNDGAFICGIEGRTAKIQEIYENLEIEITNAKYKIFMFHHTVNSASQKFADMPLGLLPKGFNYYAGGHWHSYHKQEYDHGTLVYPGSTEYWDAREMREDKEKKVIIIDTETGIKEITVPTRKIRVITIESNNLTPEQITEKSMKELEKTKIEEGEFIQLEMKGTLKGNIGMINKQKIQNIIKEKTLACRIITTELYTDEAYIKSRGKTISEIEIEYLKDKGYKTEEIELALRMIKIFGEKNCNTAEKFIREIEEG